MGFDPQTYIKMRNEPLKLANNYLSCLSENEMSRLSLFNYQNNLLDMPYYDLLILQSNQQLWNKLIQQSDLYFRKMLLLKSMNISITLIGKLLDKSKMSISDMINKGTILREPANYELAVLLNYPVQSIFYESPNPSSFSVPEQFYVPYNRVFLQELDLSLIVKQYDEVNLLAAYVIKPKPLDYIFNTNNLIGRWVKTFPEFHYFEFQLSKEPIIDHVLKQTIKDIFPKAEFLVTTFAPLRNNSWRYMKIIIPNNRDLPTYKSMIYELEWCREKTEFHRL